MTFLQLQNERESLNTFVEETVKRIRARGDDAGTTAVMIAAARVAADMAPRLADGSIDVEVARVMLKRAVSNLGRKRFL